jgi:hypothetical protein
VGVRDVTKNFHLVCQSVGLDCFLQLRASHWRHSNSGPTNGTVGMVIKPVQQAVPAKRMPASEAGRVGRFSPKIVAKERGDLHIWFRDDAVAHGTGELISEVFTLVRSLSFCVWIDDVVPHKVSRGPLVGMVSFTGPVIAHREFLVL